MHVTPTQTTVSDKGFTVTNESKNSSTENYFFQTVICMLNEFCCWCWLQGQKPSSVSHPLFHWEQQNLALN